MSKKLLLADDSITIQKVIGITFANEDYELCVVDNGDAGFDKTRSERPDLVLADVFMPGKNGYELCAAIKRDPALRHIPVLLLTGTFEPFDEAKAKAAGADSWIAKPFES
ncbi:MAG: response regulator, partial [Desulfuromonadales bacterium]|nr:response regulator [Desulfuromonadales bacterium]